MTTRVLLIRHAQTAWNASGRYMGQMDIPLDEVGLSQAAAVAHRLATERPLTIYTSDLQRALQTAQAIEQAIAASAHPEPPPPLIAEPRLREMHFGEWQGRTYAEIQAAQPEAFKDWEAHFLNFAPPDGESLIQMSARVLAAFNDICTAHPDGTVALVGHGGSVQALITHLLGLPPERMWQFQARNTAVSEVRLFPAGAILHLFNDICHLAGLN